MRSIHIYVLLAAMACSSAHNVSASDKIVAEISPYVVSSGELKASAITNYMPDGETFLKATNGNRIIKQYDLKSGNEIATIFDASHTRESNISSFDSFAISPDGTKLLIATNTTPIYRRSFKATYYTFDIKRNILRPLSKEYTFQQSPVFSPDSRMVAFVSDNNINLRKLDYDTEIAVTSDGKAGEIINGIPDWTYEEEFSTVSSMAWSNDNSTLCFLSYDESKVPEYTFPLYQGSCSPMNEFALYPGSFRYKYPVAGENNSIVSIKSYDVSTRKTKEIDLTGVQSYYIPRIDFAPEGNELFVTTLNRNQNRMEILSVNPKSTIVKSIIVEESQCWIDPIAYENLTFTSASIILNSSRSGYNNLYEYSLTGSMLRNITPADRDVTACYGVDDNGTVYYQSISDSPLSRAVYRTDKKGTAPITATDAYASAVFSPRMKNCVISISSATCPPVYTLNYSDGKEIRKIEDNSEYASRHSNIPQKEFVTIPSEGTMLNAYIIKPLNFDPTKKYPVIMTQYSGPGSQTVLNRWEFGWEQYAAENGFIVVCVDPRGTGGRGRTFMDIVYRNLGHYETIDQINAANHLASLPYVDKNNIGICGWSYGGYEALMCATAPESPFNAAVAIAPVTDWRYYDTVYAERYMLTPQENETGYDNSAPINRANSLSCPLLLMAGTADDNVHLSNTLEFVSKLQSHGILCDMLLFPNMNHSINGCDSRAVVYGKMIKFFSDNLK